MKKLLLTYILILVLIFLASIIYLPLNSFAINFDNVLAVYRLVVLKFIPLPDYLSKSRLFVTLIYLLPFSLLKFVFSGPSARQIKLLRNLGYSLKVKDYNRPDSYQDPTIKITKKAIEIVSPVSKPLDEVQGQKEILEGIFNSKFSEIKKSTRVKDNTYTLIIDRFDKLKPDQYTPVKKYALYYGVTSDGKPTEIDIETNWSQMHIGASGSGKTTLEKALLSQARHKFPFSKSRILVLDSKVMDYTEEFIKDNSIEFYEMNSQENYEKALETLRAIRDCCRGENKDFLRKNGFNHSFRAFEKGLTTPLGSGPLFIFCDEFGRYLTTETTGMSKESKETLKAISEVVTDLLSTGRAHGIILIFSNQKIHLSNISISPDNVTLLGFNGASKEILAKYGSISDRTPVLGRWNFISDSIGNIIVKTTRKIYANKPNSDRPEE